MVVSTGSVCICSGLIPKIEIENRENDERTIYYHP